MAGAKAHDPYEVLPRLKSGASTLEFDAAKGDATKGMEESRWGGYFGYHRHIGEGERLSI